MCQPKLPDLSNFSVEAVKRKLEIDVVVMRVSFSYPGIPIVGAVVALAVGGMISSHPAFAQAASPSSARVDDAVAPTHSAGESTSRNEGQKQPDSPFGAFENNKNRGPVNIESDSMALDYKGNAVLFSGKVHATQADGTLTSNTLHVKYGKDFHEIQEMVADGEVHISQGLRWCTADRGVMNQASHTVVLTGNPICHDQNDQIAGMKITVHTDTGKSDVDGRVKAVIFPHDSKNGDNGDSSAPAKGSSAQAKAE